MSEERIKKIVVAPAYISALYEGKTFNNFSVGKVTYEAESVEGRRAYVSTRLTETGWKNFEDILKRNGHLDKVEFLEKIPKNWRHTSLL